MQTRSLAELLSLTSSKSSPTIISEQEHKSIKDFIGQPIHQPLQIVGRGNLSFEGIQDNFETDTSCLSAKEVDSGKVIEFWFHVKP